MFSYHNTMEFAQQMDAQDNLKDFRKRFIIPQHNGSTVVYFCGNSLGLQPGTTRAYINQELDDWAALGVEGHFRAKYAWFPYHNFLRESTSRLVGALPSEVVIMNQLTVNLHLMLVSFYVPTAERYKIIIEANAFPSDRYAVQSHAFLHGFEKDDAIIELTPRSGEYILRAEDILKAIAENEESLALVILGGVNYYSGQLFNMKEITLAAHKAGAYCGFDLAHAAGNVMLDLHKWNVDFAVWCSYKYLNSSPGGVAGCFVHQHHGSNFNLPRLAGWWGNNPDTRFEMPHDFIPTEGADGWQLSNAPIMAMACLRASMDIYEEATMLRLTAKSKLLTGYLEFIIDDVIQKLNLSNKVSIITPRDENERGSQLSLIIKKNGKKVYQYLADNGVIVDWREPEVLRMAPVPLYNSFEDVYRLWCAF
ncbi:MAG: kynureninase [Bacteroidetes bacterium]|nr:kynureninase [Bacteroidota bacterium]